MRGMLVFLTYHTHSAIVSYPYITYHTHTTFNALQDAYTLDIHSADARRAMTDVNPALASRLFVPSPGPRTLAWPPPHLHSWRGPTPRLSPPGDASKTPGTLSLRTEHWDLSSPQTNSSAIMCYWTFGTWKRMFSTYIGNIYYVRMK